MSMTSSGIIPEKMPLHLTETDLRAWEIAVAEKGLGNEVFCGRDGVAATTADDDGGAVEDRKEAIVPVPEQISGSLTFLCSYFSVSWIPTFNLTRVSL